MTSLLIETQTPAEFEKAPQAAEKQLDDLFADYLNKFQDRAGPSPQVFKDLSAGEGAAQGDVIVQFLGDNRPSQRNYDLMELTGDCDHPLDYAAYQSHILESASGLSRFRTLHPTVKMFAHVTDGPLVLRHAPHEESDIHRHDTLIFNDRGWYAIRVQRGLQTADSRLSARAD